MQSHFLWVQQQVQLGIPRVEHIPGVRNRSDALTKPLNGPDLLRHCQNAGLQFL